MKNIVFVDSENVSKRFWRKIFHLASENEERWEFRIYRREHDLGTMGWSQIVKNEVWEAPRIKIKEIRIAGKASKQKVDKIIISEMLLMRMDCAWIISSDHGYGKCLDLLREKKVAIKGMGNGEKFGRHCDLYLHL